METVAGFVRSQALHALVELRILHMLSESDLSAEALARRTGVPVARLDILMRAGAALGLVARRRDGRFALARRGAALLGVPGLEAMILHHSVLYRDLADPAAFFRGETDPDLARFWPYVFGADGAGDPETVGRYSDLMADSQALVADDVLSQASFAGARRLMDVGGGSGAFVVAALARHPSLSATLVDLPAVMPSAQARIGAAGVSDRVTLHPASFRDDPLPVGADLVSLVRVLYDHADPTVRALLAKVRAALPPGGRLLVAEPMAGDASTDVYFSVYTLAMGTGKTRSASEIAALLDEAGFTAIRQHRARRPYVTGLVTAEAPRDAENV